jgi:hypothetical protein
MPRSKNPERVTTVDEMLLAHQHPRRLLRAD